MNLIELKQAAQDDMKNNNGEWGSVDGFVDGKVVVVMASKVGYNKPGRKTHVRFKIVEKEQG